MRGFGNLKYLGFNNHLLPAVRGKIKYKDGQEGDAHAGDDQIDCVEQGLPPHRDVEGDVQVRLVTARVELDIPLSWHLSMANQDLLNVLSLSIFICIELSWSGAFKMSQIIHNTANLENDIYTSRMSHSTDM